VTEATEPMLVVFSKWNAPIFVNVVVDVAVKVNGELKVYSTHTAFISKYIFA
jgi:hypothetical protein